MAEELRMERDSRKRRRGRKRTKMYGMQQMGAKQVKELSGAA